MIIQQHQHSAKHAVAKGLTLLELTVVLVIGLMIATITLVLFNNQLAAFSVLRTQNFMIREAPQINSILNRLVSRADSLHLDKDNPKITLTFIDPADNTATTADIEFADQVLTYTSGDNSWDISTSVANVSFAVDSTGVLRTTLTGPNAGQITYSTTPLQ